MKSITEIRFHGRGGQGAKTAAQILAEAALDCKKQIQAFPDYGPERTGAPVRIYVKISNAKIKSYAPVTEPDIVVVIDDTLIKSEDVTQGLTKEGKLIINSDKNPEDIRKSLKSKYSGKIVCFDATSISLKHLKRNIPNTVMLGVLAKATALVPISKIYSRIKTHFEAKIGPEKTKINIDMVKEAYESLQK